MKTGRKPVAALVGVLVTLALGLLGQPAAQASPAGAPCTRAGYPGVYGEVQAFSDAIKARISPSGTIVR
jgi:hypothetical protein